MFQRKKNKQNNLRWPSQLIDLSQCKDSHNQFSFTAIEVQFKVAVADRC